MNFTESYLFFAKFYYLKVFTYIASNIFLGTLLCFVVIEWILLSSFCDRYYYDVNNFLIRVNVDGNEDTLYHYSEENSGLIRVTNPDLTWIQFNYNADGLYAGVQHYSNNNILLRGVEYNHTGPGEVQMIEHSKYLKSVLKYNIYGKLAYIKKDGSPAYKFINDKVENIGYYVDDLVKKSLVYLVK